MRLLRLAIVTLCLSLSFVAHTARADDATALYNEGRDAFHARDFQKAYERYKAAFALRQSSDIAGNLAQAEVELGKKSDAATHVVYALRLLPANPKPGTEAALKDMLAKLRKDVCTLHIATSVAGAAITVDGASKGTAPLADPVFVDPGSHVVDASLSAHTSTKKPIEAKAGADLDVSVYLVPDASTPPPSDGRPIDAPPHRDHEHGTPTTPRSSPRPLWPGGLVLGIGAVGLGVGIGSFVIAGNASSSAEHIATTQINGKGRCGPANPASLSTVCDQFGNEVSTHNTFTTVGGVMMGVGGAAVGAGILLLVLPRGGDDAPPSGSASAVVPWVGPTVGGASVLGRW